MPWSIVTCSAPVTSQYKVEVSPEGITVGSTMNLTISIGPLIGTTGVVFSEEGVVVVPGVPLSSEANGLNPTPSEIAAAAMIAQTTDIKDILIIFFLFCIAMALSPYGLF